VWSQNALQYNAINKKFYVRGKI